MLYLDAGGESLGRQYVFHAAPLSLVEYDVFELFVVLGLQRQFQQVGAVGYQFGRYLYLAFVEFDHTQSKVAKDQLG